MCCAILFLSSIIFFKNVFSNVVLEITEIHRLPGKQVEHYEVNDWATSHVDQVRVNIENFMAPVSKDYQVGPPWTIKALGKVVQISLAILWYHLKNVYRLNDITLPEVFLNKIIVQFS